MNYSMEDRGIAPQEPEVARGIAAPGGGVGASRFLTGDLSFFGVGVWACACLWSCCAFKQYTCIRDTFIWLTCSSPELEIWLKTLAADMSYLSMPPCRWGPRTLPSSWVTASRSARGVRTSPGCMSCTWLLGSWRSGTAGVPRQQDGDERGRRMAHSSPH
jgi:hypothetical protein